ncbi:MAG: protein-L-isoaspartate(D-aspartate) O-methyltransferase [Anaerolineales bacterium]|nr:protein-L-isoaspartate(D-aspartate) O-methyltransferase [Anaerolineales bacterium]
MMSEDLYTSARHSMVVEQLVERGITDPRVIHAMSTVPRHQFVPDEVRDQAYDDGPLPIGENQTISQPYIVALMTELLNLQGHETILEIGTGSGYQAAILGKLARQVYSIERHEPLAQQAARVLDALGYTNIVIMTGDGSRGLLAHGPYEGILVTAATPRVPQILLAQLADGGRLIAPSGGEKGQQLERWTRRGARFKCETLIPVAFVPLRGKLGWQDNEWRP